MKTLAAIFSFLFFVLAGASVQASKVIHIEIRGTINPGSSGFLKESIKFAESTQAALLLVELDTPGGLVTSVREMAQVIDETRVPVAVYVSPAGASATSAGALLMMASHYAVMAPGTNIGAAHPVGSQGEEVKGPMGEKVTNDVAAFAKGLAELRGRNRDVAEAIVRKSRSLTAQEALKEGVVDLIAEKREDVLVAIQGKKVKLRQGEVVVNVQGALIEKHEMTMGQKLLDLLANPNIAAILMTLAMLLIYVEVSNPGITVAGVLGGICLLIAFMAFQVLPIRTGGLALLLLGVVMMIVEPLVAAHGALAGGGALAFILGLLWVFDPAGGDVSVSMGVMVPLGIFLVGSAVGLGYLAARTKKMAKDVYAKIGGGGVGGLAGYEGHVESVGEDGFSGKAVFRGEIWDFESQERVSLHDPVRAKALKGFKVMIERIKEGKT